MTTEQTPLPASASPQEECPTQATWDRLDDAQSKLEEIVEKGHLYGDLRKYRDAAECLAKIIDTIYADLF